MITGEATSAAYSELSLATSPDAIVLFGRSAPGFWLRPGYRPASWFSFGDALYELRIIDRFFRL